MFAETKRETVSVAHRRPHYDSYVSQVNQALGADSGDDFFESG